MAESITKLGETDTFTGLSLNKPQSAEQALEEIQTPKFFDTLKSFYSYREGKDVVNQTLKD